MYEILALEGLNMMTSSNGNIFHVTGPLCGEFTGPGEFPAQRPVTRSFDVFFDLRLNKRLSKQQWGWWFETPSLSLWRQCNDVWNFWNNLFTLYHSSSCYSKYFRISLFHKLINKKVRCDDMFIFRDSKRESFADQKYNQVLISQI